MTKIYPTVSTRIWLSAPLTLLLLAACGGADAPTHDVSKQARASANPAQTSADDKKKGGVVDGSFEAGTDNPYWSATPGTLCTTQVCGDGAGTAGPEDGLVWAWFGGSAEAVTQTLEQTVTLPRGSAELGFELWAGAVSASTFTFEVRLDDGVVYTLTANDAEDFAKGYSDVKLDLSSYADDETHTLLFTFVKDGGGDTNLSLDEVSLVVKGLDDAVPDDGLDEAVQEIVAVVKSLSLKKGLERALVAKLDGATRAFKRGHNQAGAKILKAFTNQVNARSRSRGRGKKPADIAPDDASKLIESAQKIIAAVF